MNGYQHSQDYKVLYYLLIQGYDIVCFVDYNFRSLEGKTPPSRDIAIAKNQDTMLSVGVRGMCYFYVNVNDIEFFYEICEKYNLSFIKPF